MESKLAGIFGFILALLGVGGVAWLWKRLSKYLGIRTDDNNPGIGSGSDTSGSRKPKVPDDDSAEREREIAESKQRTDSAKDSFGRSFDRITELLRQAREQGKVVDSGDTSSRGDIPGTTDSGVSKEPN